MLREIVVQNLSTNESHSEEDPTDFQKLASPEGEGASALGRGCSSHSEEPIPILVGLSLLFALKLEYIQSEDQCICFVVASPSLNEVRSQGTARSSHHNAAASQTIFAILSSQGKMNF
jgi:hypothetical protein